MCESCELCSEFCNLMFNLKMHVDERLKSASM